MLKDIGGVVALEFMADAPYFKKLWELSDESSLVSMKPRVNSKDDKLNCSISLDVDPDYSIFPPCKLNSLFLIPVH